MPLQFTISPDYNANRLSQWFILNSRLQRCLGESCHLELHDDFGALRDAINGGRVDVIYANAFDTAIVLREKGFVPVARGGERSDEALVAVHASSPVAKVADFKPGLRVVSTDAPDVETIGRILLEPADLDRSNVGLSYQKNYVLVAKSLINGEADAGFFLKESYDDLSDLVRRQLRPVVSSRIYVVRHALLVSPALAARREMLLAGLLSMSGNPADRELLAELGFPEGWKPLEAEEAEFMVDMMETLLP
jgi:phosphonate transport system substrate-binding protein